MRDRTDKQTTSKDWTTQLLICEPLSFAIKTNIENIKEGQVHQYNDLSLGEANVNGRFEHLVKLPSNLFPTETLSGRTLQTMAD